MSTREISSDTVGSLLANTANPLTIALGESWLKLAERLNFVERAIAEESNEIEQMIAALFPDEFPTYPEDWPGWRGPDGLRCVGEHIPITMVMVLIDKYKALDAELDEKEKALADWEDKCGQLEDELKDLQEERGNCVRQIPYGREREAGAW